MCIFCLVFVWGGEWIKMYWMIGYVGGRVCYKDMNSSSEQMQEKTEAVATEKAEESKDAPTADEQKFSLKLAENQSKDNRYLLVYRSLLIW